MKNFYLLAGSVFSFVYIFAGIAIISGKLNFNLNATPRLLIGCGILAYGIFRAYLFYKRIRSEREDGNN